MAEIRRELESSICVNYQQETVEQTDVRPVPGCGLNGRYQLFDPPGRKKGRNASTFMEFSLNSHESVVTAIAVLIMKKNFDGQFPHFACPRQAADYSEGWGQNWHKIYFSDFVRNCGL